MGKALCLIGFLGFFACNMWLIIVNAKEQSKKSCYLSLAASAILFISGIALITPNSIITEGSISAVSNETCQAETNDDELSSKNNTYITKDKYDRIEKGTSYDEVKEIIGTDGTAYYKSGDKNSDSYIVNYEWRGDNPFSVALITCEGKNQKVTSKSQGGLM